MPIRVSELEEAKKPLKDRIFAWLARRTGQAFRLEEIISGMTGTDAATIELVLALGSMDPTSGVAKEADAYKPYVQALEMLKTERRIETGEVRGSTYYYAAEKNQ